MSNVRVQVGTAKVHLSFRPMENERSGGAAECLAPVALS